MNLIKTTERKREREKKRHHDDFFVRANIEISLVGEKRGDAVGTIAFVMRL